MKNMKNKSAKTISAKLIAFLAAAAMLIAGAGKIPKPILPITPSEPPIVEPGDITDGETDEPTYDENVCNPTNNEDPFDDEWFD